MAHARKTSRSVALILALLASAAGPTTAPAQQAAPAKQALTDGRSRDEAAIRAAARGYSEALARGDGPTLARLWTADGDIVDDEGRTLNGRETVAQIEPAPADAPRPAVQIKETNLRFITADVTIEDGTVEVRHPGAAEPLAGWFSATWVRTADGWKIAGLRESRITAPADNPQLDDLAWMVGDWQVVEEHPDREAGDVAPPQPAAPPSPARPPITVSVRWDVNRSFLIREMRIGGAAGVEPAMQITQRIGWDPLSRQIVSWVFGSDGSHGEATWSRQDGSWVARTMAVLPDGTQTSALNIYTYDGGDRCTWRSIPTHVGGEHAPHVAMTMVRSGAPATSPREQTP
ncbi:MAG: hypothetical protein RLZZ111_1351 [Planctomycetota bacterium]